jgi:hypothetical protein
VSIVPFPIDERKPGLIPGSFHVDACLNENEPVCQVIGDSFFYVYIDADRGNLRVPAPSHIVARSLCDDYNIAQLEVGPECHPGLFWLPGIWTTEKLLKGAQDELAYAREAQTTWFINLVKRADDDWEKTRQHYAISDVQRYALRRIDPENKQNRPWVLVKPQEVLKSLEEVPTQLCAACGSDIPMGVVICKYCHCILDPERYQKMAFVATPPPSSGFDLSKVM